MIGEFYLRCILLSALIVAPVIANCGTSSSSNLVVTRSVSDNGGGLSSSFSFRLHNSIGQSSPISSSVSTSFHLYAGFEAIPDTDSDGITDDLDNCRILFNPDQLDTDSDQSGNLCDIDDDNDGLEDSTETILGTDLLNTDSDGDGLDDYSEVNFDGDPFSYQPGVDADPNNPDTDGDGVVDGADSDPLVTNIGDGDIAPRGAPDGIVNSADLLIAHQIVLGQIIPTANILSHGDVYPPGSPDGVINMSDLLLIRQLILSQP